MERTCKVCNQIKNTPYKDICRNCYQNNWLASLPDKSCSICKKTFNMAGKICHTCRSNHLNKESRKIACSVCKRVGLIIANKTDILCIMCNRKQKEIKDPYLADKRRDYLMKYSRKKRGTDLNAPKRESKGWWKTSQGYIITYNPSHPNAKGSGCISQHTYVMSEYLDRPLTKDENVHHINGIRDDNRIENLELWSNSHPPGQRVVDKIKWAKEILMKYEDMC